jgi:glycosyltransferase involved in cell wall biosynthesis
MKEGMRILVAHNRYQQAGGEDSVVRAEVSLLRAKGHPVEIMEEDNDSIVRWVDAARTAIQCVHSNAASRMMCYRIAQFKPDLVHIHNFFPRFSPSIHYACRNANIPVIQTLHNYRLLCPASTLLRDGNICEECVGKAYPWPAVQHGCYKKSKLATAAVANMLSLHRTLGTWDCTVTRFIALTEFARNKFIEGGLPADKIVVKPNFVDPDPGMGAGNGGYALFVGRLSEEKGLGTLLAAWERIGRGHRLKIVGEGPLARKVKNAAETVHGIEWLGMRSNIEVSRLMADATILVLPSVWYEGFPLVLVEAFASGLPIIASRLGAMAELVTDGKTGRLFTPGNVDELAASVEWVFSNHEYLGVMRQYARDEYLNHYAAESNYAVLSRIYRSAVKID